MPLSLSEATKRTNEQTIISLDAIIGIKKVCSFVIMSLKLGYYVFKTLLLCL